MRLGGSGLSKKFTVFTEEQNEEIRSRLRYDPESGQILWVRHNYKKAPLTVAGSPCRKGYTRVHILGKKIAAHRLAWFFSYGYWPELEVDHINGDKSDNRIENLRLATRSQNQMNKLDPETKGVGYYRKYNKWRARIAVNRKLMFLGYFDTFEEAKAAYDEAAKKYHAGFTNIK